MERPVVDPVSPYELLEAFYAQQSQMLALEERLVERDQELAEIRQYVPSLVHELPPDPRYRVKRWETADGWTIATVHWSLVPGYDYEAACEGLSPQAIRQEVEIDWQASGGLRVYPEYGPFHLAAEPLEFDPERPLYCGWDFGAHAGGTPAWVPSQINTFGQWLIFPPIAPLPEEPIGTYEFGQLVADHLQREYATPAGKSWKQLKLLHFGDPNGNQRPARTGQRPEELATHFEILKTGIRVPLGQNERGEMRYQVKPGFGFSIKGGPVEITPRLEAVRARLNMLLPGNLPALVVDPRATVIKDGFGGGYHRKRRSDGSYEGKPDKNWYSHAFDALAYIAACLFRTFEEEEEPHVARARGGFRCQAAGRSL
jgi:hypothetical protein